MSGGVKKASLLSFDEEAMEGDDTDFKSKMKSISATGISEIELKCNDQISSYKQADLNLSPKLPYPDNSMDVVTCVVSFDYLTKPRQGMREIRMALQRRCKRRTS